MSYTETRRNIHNKSNVKHKVIMGLVYGSLNWRTGFKNQGEVVVFISYFVYNGLNALREEREQLVVFLLQL